MLESLIAMQAILFNVNGATVIPRSFSTGATTVLTNRVIDASNKYGYYYGSRPDADVPLRQRFGSTSRPLQLRAHPPSYFAKPGWTPRLSSTLSSSSPSMLLAARGGGDLNDYSKANFSTDNSKKEQKEDDIIEIPFREYGYRSTPFTWEELDQIIVQEQNLAKLSRSVPQEQEYQRALRQLKKEWKSTKDYILHSKFHLPKLLDETTQLYFVDDSANQQPLEALRTVVPNDFPYYCAPGIEHWVLWKYGGGGDDDSNSSISQEDVTWAKEEILQQLKSRNDNGGSMMEDDVIWWENPPNLKSLPEISHVHLLVRQHMEAP